MASFRYIAVTPSGERVVGVLTGVTEGAVLAELDARRLTPVHVGPHRAKRGLRLSGRVSTRQLAAAYGQLSDLLRAGVPLLRGLRLLGNRRSAPALAKVFTDLAESVAEGTDLAESMEARDEVFPKVHIAMIRAGERGGFLEPVLLRLSKFLSAQAEMRAKIIGNLIYPAVLVVAGVAVVIVISAFFIPIFKPIFAKLDASGQLPGVTRVVLAFGDVISGYGLVLAVLAAVLAAAAWGLLQKPRCSRQLAIWSVKAPVLGPICRAMAVSRFCRILGTMLGNSIPLLAAMQIARDAAGNVLLEEAIDRATEAVRAGQPLAPPLAESGLFPDDVLEMIAVGESANNLDEVLVTIAETVEARLERLLSIAVKLIEPAMLLILAVLIGTVAIALILPMSKMAQTVQ